MSAESPRRTVRGVPAIVPPQVVSDPSIIDSVAGFINDVTLTNPPQLDPRDTITWARFETQTDISDPQFGNEDWELEGCAPPSLILILGYGVGIQVWAIPANGEAVEVLSWRHGNITALRVLPTPTSTDVNFDRFLDKRALMALCEGPTSNSGPQYCTVNFVSLKDGSTVKSIKFKNPVLDILTNKTFVVITFPERIAIFDARSLDDHLSITTCYPSPGINPNPVALGHRWLAYSENKLIHTKRSQGGCEVEGVPSYTATMLNAAKSLGKGLKELGETVAAGLKGSSSGPGSSSKLASLDSSLGDTKQCGVVTVFDIKNPIKDISPTSGTPITVTGDDPIIAHFVAHSDAIVAMEFDPSGMLLITADKRGHDFHVYKIFNHATSSNLSAVHHLYILHRGDTSAKVQNIAFSPDARWVAVSTLRGTTHVFPITPYGGLAGVRTHTNPHVVNRLSRFHRSAGLSPDGRSSSPISSHSDSIQYNSNYMPYNNAMMSTFPKPIVVNPLAKLRQPSVLGSPPGSAQNSYSRSSHSRQRLSSLSDDNGKPLSVCAVFAKARSWLLDGPKLGRDPHKTQQKVVDSLFIMAGHGALIQYDLDVKTAQNVAKDKVCDESPIELEVEAKAQWNLGRKDNSVEIQPPLLPDNWLMKERSCSNTGGGNFSPQIDDWVSQVEIMTHAGPGRRLWMGPQCVFKTYNTPSGSSLNHIDTEAVEVPINVGSSRPGRSSPMNMPLSNSERSSVPFVIESGSYSSIEQSPRLIEKFCHNNLNSEYDLSQGESRLKEDLADAMRDLPSGQHKETGLTPRVLRTSSLSSMPSTSAINSGSDINNYYKQGTTTTANATYNSTHLEKLDNISNNTILSSSPLQTQQQNQPPARSVVLIEKVVNPQGTVTTVTRSPNNVENEYDPNDPYAWLETDYVIHENFDEALFRPVVTIFCDNSQRNDERKLSDFEFVAPEPIRNDLVIPVIEGNRYYSDLQCGDGSGGGAGGADDVKQQQPESISTELIIPVIEENKKKKKSEKCDGNDNINNDGGKNKNSKEDIFQKNDSTIENVMIVEDKVVPKTDEIIPAGNKKSRNNKKSGNNAKEKSPPLPKYTGSDTAKHSSSSSLSYANENYGGGGYSINTNHTESAAVVTHYKKEGDEENFEETTKKINKTHRNKSSENIQDVVIDLIITNTEDNTTNKATRARKSEERECKTIEKPTKTNGKQRKSSKVEIIPDENMTTTNFSFMAGPIKTKAEKLTKTKVLAQENDQKKMTRVSSDTKIANKIKYSTAIGGGGGGSKDNMASSCVEVEQKQQQTNLVEKNFSSERPLKADDQQAISTKKAYNYDGGLQFYDKFDSDSPISDISNDSKTEHIQIEVEFPSLADTLIVENRKSRKQKGGPSSPTNVISPQVSPKVPKKKISEKFSELKLSDDDTAPAAAATTAASEVVTITLPSYKKKQKKNSQDDNNSKKYTQANEKSAKAMTSFSLDQTDSSMDMNSKEKFIKKGKNHNNKSKDIRKPSVETVLNTDFSEDDTFLPPLSSLEPFESNFDNLHFNKDETGSNGTDDGSLINLDSPPQDGLKQANNYNVSSSSNPLNISSDSMEVKSLQSGYENLIFALCDSLHYDDDTPIEDTSHILDGSQQISSSITNTSTSATVVLVKKYSKESHRKSFSENDEYLSLDPNYTENTSSSSEDIDETTCIRKKTHQKLIDDDEELRPLISGANSACSMTSSTSGKKEDDTPSIALEIAKAIVDTLPDSNQSDSSDQANISEPDGAATSLDEATSTASTRAGSGGTSPPKGSAHLIDNGTGGGGGGNLQSLFNHQNKKKLKKKKR